MAAKTCSFCGSEFDEYDYCVRIEGVAGVFDRFECAFQAASQQRREERRERLRLSFMVGGFDERDAVLPVTAETP